MSGKWADSDRRTRLPDDWKARREEAKRRNPKQLCHWCGKPNANDLDHVIPGDDHAQSNLAWIHGKRDVQFGRSIRNCHSEKTAQEAAAGRRAAPRLSQHRPPEQHPALG